MYKMGSRKADALCNMARAFAPREVCGLILKDGAMLMVPNVAKDNFTFVMDTKETIRLYHMYGDDIIGVFHTHPGGREFPSEMDSIYAPKDLRYFIATTTSVIEWKFDGDERSGKPRAAHMVDEVYRIAADPGQGPGASPREGVA